MKAVWVTKDVREIRDFEIPKPGPDEVLIKNIVVSSNPKDYKVPLWYNRSSVEGSDAAGYVEAVGSGVTAFVRGDKVAAFTKMGSDDKYGTYAEYTVSPDWTTFTLGPKTSFEDAAALPLAYMTAAIGLYCNLGYAPESSEAQRPLLLYGAGTTVGNYVIQLAKQSGIRVIGVAGSSIQQAKNAGIDVTIDYRGKSEDEVAAEITEAIKGTPVHVYDAVSVPPSTEIIAKGLDQDSQGIYTYVQHPSEERLKLLPAGYVTLRTAVGTAHAENKEFAREWFKKAGKEIEEGIFKAQKTTIIPDGLAGVKEGLRRLEAGEVNGEKLVYRIADTPGIVA